MKAICVDNSGYLSRLTNGKKYEVENSVIGMYRLYDNFGDSIECFKWRFEIVKEEVVMKKSDLKVSMIVETREGKRYIVLENEKGIGLSREGGQFSSLANFKENLTHNSDKCFDIIKIYKIKYIGSISSLLSNTSCLTLIWERKDNSEAIKKVREDIASAEKALKEAQDKLRELED